ncbi:MAG: hypothetical protein ACK5TD_01635, partial [bacterium]
MSMYELNNGQLLKELKNGFDAAARAKIIAYLNDEGAGDTPDEYLGGIDGTGSIVTQKTDGTGPLDNRAELLDLRAADGSVTVGVNSNLEAIVVNTQEDSSFGVTVNFNGTSVGG